MREGIRNWIAVVGGLLVFAGLPAVVARFDTARVASGASTEARPRSLAVRPPSPPPPVEPVRVLAVEREEARDINARVPFSRLPNPAARPFTFAGAPDSLARAIDCLAAAGYYEAGDDTTGQKSVAQVVLNRLRHPAFPKTVCGVVFQGAERRTGCQFTFTCDGALARTPSVAAWDRARDVARAALSGTVYRKVGYSTHYHTDWVVPYWSSSLDKVAAVKTHLFFRWTGWWGTPPAFRRIVSADEPVIPQIARLSPAHQGTPGTALLPGSGLGLLSPATMAAGTARLITPKMGADGLAGVTLMAVDSGAGAFILLVDPKKPETYANMAAVFCTGRQRCRILAWNDRAAVPRSFPISETALSSMAFSYIHDAASGLQRALWNCTRTPRPNRAECMRVREPAAAVAPPAVAPTGVAPPAKGKPPETVVITKPF
ncbi:MAG: cell wall hydrolase [Sphingobium sp.]|uniref:cell wall hydrolase n=1 Tax=Sphingobium sp. TaxID=1912891 RepID=UPI0029AE8BFA|nr:cell wall hydrolase [Sphingobium sp.]MDX3911417.1 cell wall hydrolase [Sphingobium sp.]